MPRQIPAGLVPAGGGQPAGPGSLAPGDEMAAGYAWPLAALVIASAFWGLAVTGTKYALGGFGPVTLLAVELVTATVALWMVLLVRGYRRLRIWWLPVLLGLLEPGLAYLGQTIGLSLTSAVNGAVISGLESAMVVLLAGLLLRETVTLPTALAVAVAFGGLLVLAGSGMSHVMSLGDFLVAGGMLSASTYTIAVKRFGDEVDPLALTAWQFTTASVAVTAVTLVRWQQGIESPPAAVPARFWVAACIVGVAGYAVSFLLFNFVIGKVNAGSAAVVLNLIPVFGFFSAVLLLREGVGMGEATGAALISLSVLYFTIAERRAAR